MDLPHFLVSIGVKVDAAVVRAAIQKALRAPAATPSDLVEALAALLHPGGAKVVVESASAGDSAAASKIVKFLVKEGELQLKGRQVKATKKFSGH